MTSQVRSLDPRGHMPGNSQEWQALWLTIHCKSRHCVHACNLPSWRGQEGDIASDATQEGITRAYARAEMAARGEIPSLLSFAALSSVIAINYIRDNRRKDHRLIRSTSLPHETVLFAYQWIVDPSELATDAVSFAALFPLLAQIISNLPEKQRCALLTDLAYLVHFNQQPTLIERALVGVGICLHDHYRPLPLDARLRKQHSSNLSFAYRRLHEEAYKHVYITELIA